MTWQHISPEVTAKGSMQWMGLTICCGGMTVKLGDVKSECREDEGTDCKDGESDTVTGT
jgi:hypothetical protein